MPVKSLKQLATKACIVGIHYIEDVGEVPYELIRPILLRLESPDKLAMLETRSPQLLGVDAEIWKEFIKRDIPDWENKPHEPRDPKNWAKVYRKLKRDTEKQAMESASRLKAAFDSIKTEKEQNIAQIVQRAKLPMRRPTSRQVTGARFYGVQSQVRLPVNKSVSASKMAVPMHELKKRTTRIMQAPADFIRDHKRAVPVRDPRPVPITKAVTSRRPAPQPPSSSQPNLEAREDRLRALAQGTRLPTRPAEYSSPMTAPPSHNNQTTASSPTRPHHPSTHPLPVSPTYPTASSAAPPKRRLDPYDSDVRPLPRRRVDQPTHQSPGSSRTTGAQRHIHDIDGGSARSISPASGRRRLLLDRVSRI